MAEDISFNSWARQMSSARNQNKAIGSRMVAATMIMLGPATVSKKPLLAIWGASIAHASRPPMASHTPEPAAAIMKGRFDGLCCKAKISPPIEGASSLAATRALGGAAARRLAGPSALPLAPSEPEADAVADGPAVALGALAGDGKICLDAGLAEAAGLVAAGAAAAGFGADTCLGGVPWMGGVPAMGLEATPDRSEPASGGGSASAVDAGFLASPGRAMVLNLGRGLLGTGCCASDAGGGLTCEVEVAAPLDWGSPALAARSPPGSGRRVVASRCVLPS